MDAMKLKILHVINTLQIGGAEVQLINLIRNLDGGRFISIVCCIVHSGPLASDLEKLGIKLVVLGQRWKLDPRILLPLYRLIRKEHIHIVHTHMFHAGLWGRIASIITRAPVVIATEHGLNPWKRYTHIAVNRILSKFTDQITVVSDAGKRIRIERERIESKRITVVNNCVDLALFDGRIHHHDNNVRQEFGIEADEPVIGFVGRLQEVKGINYLVEAVAKVKTVIPKIKLLIIGDGPLRKELEAHVQRLELSGQVIFAGYRRDIPRVLETLDLFVLPSLREDMPLSLIEAMAMGKAVVATKVGGIPEVAVDGQTGILVSSQNEEALAEAISQILLNRQYLSGMGSAGRRCVEEKFSAEIIVRQIQELYIRLAQLKGIKVAVK